MTAARFMKHHANTNSNTCRRVVLLCLFVFFLVAAGAFPADDMTSTIVIGNSRIDVVVEKGSLEVSKEELLRWVQWAAESVSAYYGHFPIPHVLLRIIPADGKGVRNGRTFGEKGGFITIHVGSNTTSEDLGTDWMLTHEMVHLSFPSVADNHHWIEEGISTYVEPIARVRAKHMDATEMWFELVRDLHQGLPAAGDKGLDHTHTWGRTYWGGALFCFLADIEIHQKTANRKGLDDALRGILAAGGDIRQDWPLEKALDIGDQATGVPVLRPLYEKMKDQPYDVDLPAIWTELGVERADGKVRFLDTAPLSQMRVAITYGSAGSGSAAASPISILAGDTAMKFPQR
ncbi:MAG: hypothetical protein ABSF68_03020 [Candidatus Acidiferrales bacterium]